MASGAYSKPSSGKLTPLGSIARQNPLIDCDIAIRNPNPPSDSMLREPRNIKPSYNSNTPHMASMAPMAGLTSAPQILFPDTCPPPPPTYGFHMLERRSIVLADGGARSYLALPADYQDFSPVRSLIPHKVNTASNSDSFPISIQNQNASTKRKYGDRELRYEDNSHVVNVLGYDKNSAPFARTSSPFRRDGGGEGRSGKYMKVGAEGDNDVKEHLRVDKDKLNKAFLKFAKIVNESLVARNRYLEDGRQGRLRCLVCDRSSKDFQDMHELILHTYTFDNPELLVDHLGFHKALCVLMGWNYEKVPDKSKMYQFLSADKASANQEDLIMWPPMVIVHNTITGKGNDGRIEGLGNRAMDNKIRDLGFVGSKSKSLYGKEGHMGITLAKFGGDKDGLKEAARLAEYFKEENHGRRAWSRIQPPDTDKDSEAYPGLIEIDKKGEKHRVFYGYLAAASDLPTIDLETRRKVVIRSLKEL